MIKAEVFYHPIEGSSPLSIYWRKGPYGDAIEAKNEIGVGFFSQTGELLAAQFDDVEEKKDHQVLEFDRYRVEIFVSKGKISHSVIFVETPNKGPRSLNKKKTKKAA